MNQRAASVGLSATTVIRLVPQGMSPVWVWQRVRIYLFAIACACAVFLGWAGLASHRPDLVAGATFIMIVAALTMSSLARAFVAGTFERFHVPGNSLVAGGAAVALSVLVELAAIEVLLRGVLTFRATQILNGIIHRLVG